MIKAGPKCVLPCSALFVISGGGSESSEGNTAAVSFCVFFTVILLLMVYSFASLHSACLENNEGVCCINLCNGEREEGWVGDGGGGVGGGRVMSSCCCTAALLHTLCTLWSLSHVHTLAHAHMQSQFVSNIPFIDCFIYQICM